MSIDNLPENGVTDKKFRCLISIGGAGPVLGENQSAVATKSVANSFTSALSASS